MHVKEGLQDTRLFNVFYGPLLLSGILVSYTCMKKYKYPFFAISPNIMLHVLPHLWRCDTCLERRAKTDNDLESYTCTLYIFTHMHIHCTSYSTMSAEQINVRGKVKKKLFDMGKPIYTCAHTIKWVNVRNSSHVWHGKISGGGGKWSNIQSWAFC